MGILDKQSSFNSIPLKIDLKDSPVRGGARMIPAEILEVKKNRAKIRAFTGDIYDNVKLPSASINKKGQPNGRSGGWQKTQMVVLGFFMDAPNMPVVLAGLGFSANQLNEENLKTFYTAYPDFTGSIDFTDYHDSGYSIKYSDTITYYDKTKLPFLEIDFTSNTFKIVKTGVKVEFGSTADIPVSNGTVIEQWMTDMYACLNGLKSAISSAVIVPNDGGAALKTAMDTALNSNPPPEVPTDLNDTNLMLS